MYVINYFYRLFHDVKEETRIMYASDLETTEYENIEMSIVLASCQRPPFFSLSFCFAPPFSVCFLFVTILFLQASTM